MVGYEGDQKTFLSNIHSMSSLTIKESPRSYRIRITLLVLIFSLTPISAFSAPKIAPGKICKKVNTKATYAKKTFTCIKREGKLVWSKGVAIKSNAPKATPTPEATKSTQTSHLGVRISTPNH